MRVQQVDIQYTTGLSSQNIEWALEAAGKDLDHLEPSDLAPLEDFHTMGRIATAQLADLAGISGADSVLDAGSGIGGTARFLADQFGCRVTAVDLTDEYCETAKWLNRIVGLDDRISVRQGDVTDLQLPDAEFDVVTSQHVQMNVADKARLYEEARRVLVTSGRLAVWDVTALTDREIDFPVPWANSADLSHLVSPDQLAKAIEAAGFEIDQWNDLTGDVAPFMEALIALPPGPLGLHAFVPDFSEKVTNLAHGLSDGRLRVVQGLARAI